MYNELRRLIEATGIVLFLLLRDHNGAIRSRGNNRTAGAVVVSTVWSIGGRNREAIAESHKIFLGFVHHDNLLVWGAHVG